MLEPDPMSKWSPAPDWSVARISRDGLEIAPVFGLSLTRVSGNLDAAFALLDPVPQSVGLWRIADPNRAAIRIGRDRAMLVTTEPPPLPLGWRPEGFAVSDASDAYLVFDLDGASLRALAAEATAADLNADSPSASVLFAGAPALLYRISETQARLHVEAALAPFVWRWLETR